MRILITNNALAARGGTELYVRDIALGLLKRGLVPLVYSPLHGAVAGELKKAPLEVVDDLNKLTAAPDVIHGHHHVETMTAMLHFRGVPAINVCHGPISWYETPVIFPRVRRYVAVDQACRDRLLRHGIPEHKIRVLLNFVDLARFKKRAQPLPSQPQRALLFSNYANEETHLPFVREACRKTNLTLDVVGKGQGNPNAAPEEILGQYDLVFAKARCALEALAVGSAVILCDGAGVGPMVTTAELEQLRPLNFGVRTLREPLNADTLVREIKRYDSSDAAAVSSRVRAEAGLDSIVADLIALYEEVVFEYRHAPADDLDEEGQAAAAYLRRLKLDFAKHGAASLRLQEKLRSVPVLGRWGIKLVRRILPRSDD
jgi:Glycosyltransferase Family 4